ncbi:MAG: NAD-binding protein, partial [Promethearchaeota archaeon]
MTLNKNETLKEKSDELIWRIFTGDVKKEEKRGFTSLIRKIISKVMEHEWLVVLILFIITLALGYIGYTSYEIGTVDYILIWEELLRSFPINQDRLWLAIQLFALQSSFDGPLNLALDLARFLAAGLLAYVGSRAAIRLFRERWELIKLNFFRNHAIICGLGNKGTKLVKDFRRAGIPVIAIEKEANNEKIIVAQREGAIVLIGDATDESLLVKARILKARYLLAVTNKDYANVEIAADAYVLTKESEQCKLYCIVHINNLQLLDRFIEQNILPDRENITLNFFNLYENASKWLFHRFPLENFADTDSPDAPPVHLVVIGFNQMGQNVVLQALRQGHYANKKELCITIIDEKANEKKEKFKKDYPQAGKISKDIKFEQIPIEQLADKDCALIKQLIEEKDRPLSSIVICPENDSSGLLCALALLPRLKQSRTSRDCQIPIFIHMKYDAGLATLLQTEEKFKTDCIQPFGMVNYTSTRELVVKGEISIIAHYNHILWELARSIHTDYLLTKSQQEEFNGKISAGDRDLSWIKLERTLKDSCLQQADHIPIKLRAIKCGIRKLADTSKEPPPVTKFTDEEIELLAEMEHRRWMAERYLKHYTYDRTLEKADHDNKRHPHLRPFAELEKPIQNYDRR